MAKADKKQKVEDKRIESSSGLKSRTHVEENNKPLARKPNKMKLRKPNRLADKTVDYSNPALLVFPTDRAGLTTDLKKAMIAAASRVGDDKATLELLGATMNILAKHVEARFKHNTKAESPRLKRRSAVEAVVSEVQEDTSEADAEEARAQEVAARITAENAARDAAKQAADEKDANEQNLELDLNPPKKPAAKKAPAKKAVPKKKSS